MSDQNNKLVPFQIGPAPESEMIEYNMNHQQQFSGITGSSPSMLNSQQISPVVTRHPNPYPGGPAFPPPQIITIPKPIAVDHNTTTVSGTRLSVNHQENTIEIITPKYKEKSTLYNTGMTQTVPQNSCHIKIIGHGVFIVESVIENENSVQYVNIKVNNETTFTIPMELIDQQSNKVIIAFSSAGLAINKKYKHELCEYIKYMCMQFMPEKIHQGFYFDQEGTLHHQNENQILREEYDINEAIRDFSLKVRSSSEAFPDWFYTFLLFELLAASASMTLLREFGLSYPLIVFWADNVNDAYSNLMSLFMNGIRSTLPEKMKVCDYYHATDRFIPVIIDKNHYTGNIKTKANDFISAHSENIVYATSLPLIVTSDVSLFENSNVMLIPWEKLNVRNSEKAYNAFQKVILQKKEMNKFSISERLGALSEEFKKPMLRFLGIISDLVNVNESTRMQYIDFIMPLCFNPSTDIVKKFLKTLISLDHITKPIKYERKTSSSEYNKNVVFYDNNLILLNSALFSELSKMSGTSPDMMKKELAERRMLRINSQGYQYNVSFRNNTSCYMYAIDQAETFGIFNTRFQASAFIARKPDTMIQLGKAHSPCDDTDIFYTFDRTPSDNNQHCIILGKSGSGKTTLMKRMICGFVENGIGCIVIDSKQDYKQLTGEHFQHIRIGGEEGFMPCHEINLDTIISFAECLDTGFTPSQKQMLRSKCSQFNHEHFNSVEGFIDACLDNLTSVKHGEIRDVLENIKADPISHGKRLDWKDLLQNGKATIFDVDYDQFITDTTLKPIVNSMLMSFLNYKISVPDYNNCVLMINEARNYDIGTGSAISKILTQLRSKHVACFLASQFMSYENGAKVPNVISQCDTKIIFNTTDSKFINNLLQLNQENKKAVNDELASLHTGEALICNYEGTTIASARDYLSHIIRVSLSNFSADDYPELFGTTL